MRSVGGSFDLQPHVGQRGRPGNLIENPNLVGIDLLTGEMMAIENKPARGMARDASDNQHGQSRRERRFVRLS